MFKCASLYVYLSNSKAANHRADNTTHFHQQSLQRTEDVKGPTAALCQVSGTLPVDLPGTPAMEMCLYCTFFRTLSRTTLGILTPFR